MEATPCPACGRPSLRRLAAGDRLRPAARGPRRFELVAAPSCGSAVTVGDAPDRAAMYEGGTYAPARRARCARLLGAAPRGSPSATGCASSRRSAPAARGCSRSAPATASWSRRCAPPGSRRAGSIRRRRPARPPRRSGSRSPTRASTRPRSSPGPRTPSSSGTRSSISTDPAGALARIRGWLRPAGADRGRGPEPGLACRRGSAATAGFTRTSRATAPTSPRPGLTALLERSGFRVERIRHLLVEQNPLGMWQTLLNRLTARARLRLPGAEARPRPGGPVARPATGR